MNHSLPPWAIAVFFVAVVVALFAVAMAGALQ